MDIRGRFARNVRRYRVAAGLTQEVVAIDAELPAAHVSRIERGVANPTLLVIARIAKALGVAVETLFAEPPPGRTPLATLKRGRKRGRSVRR